MVNDNEGDTGRDNFGVEKEDFGLEEGGLAGFLDGLRFLSMRRKISLIATLYLCFISLMAYETRGAILSTLSTLANEEIGGFLLPKSGSLSLYELFPLGDSPDKYDYRGLAGELREIIGVTRVDLAGWIQQGTNRAIRKNPQDRSSVLVHDSAEPDDKRGRGVWVVRGRNIRDPGEVVVSEYTAELFNVGIGDRLELFGLELVIVGVFRIGSDPESMYVLDLTHIDQIMEGMKEIAAKYGVSEERSYSVDFEIRIFIESEECLNQVRGVIAKHDSELLRVFRKFGDIK